MMRSSIYSLAYPSRWSAILPLIYITLKHKFKTISALVNVESIAARLATAIFGCYIGQIFPTVKAYRDNRKIALENLVTSFLASPLTTSLLRPYTGNKNVLF